MNSWIGLTTPKLAWSDNKIFPIPYFAMAYGQWCAGSMYEKRGNILTGLFKHSRAISHNLFYSSSRISYFSRIKYNWVKVLHKGRVKKHSRKIQNPPTPHPLLWQIGSCLNKYPFPERKVSGGGGWGGCPRWNSHCWKLCRWELLGQDVRGGTCSEGLVFRSLWKIELIFHDWPTWSGIIEFAMTT